MTTAHSRFDATFSPPLRSRVSERDRGLVLFDLLQDRRYADKGALSRRNAFVEWALARAAGSKAQLFQDLWVQWELGAKRGGYFCEFGATNGVDLSNTYLLEKDFGWNGVLVEPNPVYHAELNRTRQCDISDKCVFGTSGQTLQFNCTEISHLSRLADVVPEDAHERQGKRRMPQQIINVEAISLNDLLDEVGAPDHIDYISADTEGSEYDILSQFDFGRRTVTLFTIEHNFTPMREKIHALLSAHGYERRFEELSQFDDWYIRPDLV